MLAYQKKNCTKRNTIDKKGRKIIQNQNTKFCKKPNSFSKFILSENKGTMPFKLRCMVQSSHMIPKRIAPQAAQYTFLIHQGEKINLWFKHCMPLNCCLLLIWEAEVDKMLKWLKTVDENLIAKSYKFLARLSYITTYKHMIPHKLKIVM